jgi:hypothetical protein
MPQSRLDGRDEGGRKLKVKEARPKDDRGAQNLLELSDRIVAHQTKSWLWNS